MVQTKPTIIELDMSRLDDALRRAEGRLDEQDYAMLKALADSYAYLSELVGDKNTTIARLRKLLFGAKTEKTAAVTGHPPKGTSGARKLRPPPGEPGKPRGRFSVIRTRPGTGATGRRPTPGPRRSRSLIPRSNPVILVRSAGEGRSTRRTGPACCCGWWPAADRAKVYYLQKLRCNLCGKIFKAPLPEAAAEEKYDPTVRSTLALLKYGSGMPSIACKGCKGWWAFPCRPRPNGNWSTPWPSTPSRPLRN